MDKVDVEGTVVEDSAGAAGASVEDAGFSSVKVAIASGRLLLAEAGKQDTVEAWDGRRE